MHVNLGYEFEMGTPCGVISPWSAELCVWDDVWSACARLEVDSSDTILLRDRPKKVSVEFADEADDRTDSSRIAT
jgi:hypothetical protein